ncbi:MAG: hypothetical protein GDA55_03090 [Cellvibrionales bacterium]|nr:hypothetical protein [Cellvibrionales bacterium]
MRPILNPPLLALLVLAMPVAALERPMVLFSAGPNPPPGVALYLGDAENWSVPVPTTAPTAESAGQAIRLSRQADSIRLDWAGRREGQLYLQADPPLDLSTATEAALAVTLKLHRKPRSAVTLALGCGYPCRGSADITRLLRRLPQDEWLQLTFALQCFTDLGLDSARIDSPFLLLSSGKFALSIAAIRLLPTGAATATVTC